MNAELRAALVSLVNAQQRVITAMQDAFNQAERVHMADKQQVLDALATAEEAVAAERTEGQQLQAKLDAALTQLAEGQFTPQELEEIRSRISALTTGITEVVSPGSQSGDSASPAVGDPNDVSGSPTDSGAPVGDVASGDSGAVGESDTQP